MAEEKRHPAYYADELVYVPAHRRSKLNGGTTLIRAHTRKKRSKKNPKASKGVEWPSDSTS